jgi:putative endonuclease
MKLYYVYILASKQNGTVYTGITNDLLRRVYEHKHDLVEGFTTRYRVHNLGYYEHCNNAKSAIEREKQIKKWNRNWKKEIIERHNPDWNDLYGKIL